MPRNIETIAGVPSAELRRLLRRKDFSTPVAAAALRMMEPDVSALLGALERAGYLEYVGIARRGEDHGCECWKAGRWGMKLISGAGRKPRYGRAEIAAAVAAAVDAARAYNADATNPRVISRLCVFGSALTDAASLGDLDVAIASEDRRARDEDVDEDLWPREALARAHPALSVHPLEVVERRNFPHRVVFDHDQATGMYAPGAGAVVQARPGEPVVEDVHVGALRRPLADARAVSSPVAPPAAPASAEAVRIVAGRLGRLDEASNPRGFREAWRGVVRLQHLWRAGAGREALEARVRDGLQVRDAVAAAYACRGLVRDLLVPRIGDPAPSGTGRTEHAARNGRSREGRGLEP